MNPYKVGDRVIILRSIKDAYGEIWHDKGDSLEIKYLAEDGEGLMFSSNLGIHYTEVKSDTQFLRDEKLNKILK